MLKPPLNPMLLSSKEEAFNSKDYLFEFKWDGYRSIIFIDKGSIYLQSRNKKNISNYFPEFRQLPSYFNKERLVLDGEICYLSPEGKPIFNILQKRLFSNNNEELMVKYPSTLIIWDLLSFDQKDIHKIPLIKRKEYLREFTLVENSLLQISPLIMEDGKKTYKLAGENNLEGIVAKKINSPYEFRRSKYWLKIKIWKYTEVYIGGYPIDQSSLLVGKYNEDEQLQYMGKVKLALAKNEMLALFKFLPDLNTLNSPFFSLVEQNGVNWVKPVLKCRVKYREITSHNTFRHGHATKLIF